jgi:hypothetical protein
MRSYVILAVIALCGCDPRASDLRQQMRRKSSESGLALGYIGGSGMSVYPLEGTQPFGNLENYSGPCRMCPGWFASDGKLIIWRHAFLTANGQHEGPSLLVQTITGDTVATWSGQLTNVSAVALSPDRSRIALEAPDYWPVSSHSGLQYVVLGTPKRVVLEAQPSENEEDRSESLGWSSDSRRIAFSRHNKIVLIDIETGERREIARGINPAWSPDGRWIAFTSVDNRPMLIDPSSLKQVLLGGGRKITGPLAWSPDSCCVSFSDQGRNVYDLFTLSDTRMIVFRISDGEWFPVARFGIKGGHSNRFGWFYNYKEFITHNDALKPPPTTP